MKEIRKFLVVLFVTVAFVASGNFFGFCWKNFKWISKDVKIEAAVNKLINSGVFADRYYDGKLKKDVLYEKYPIKYRDYKEFIRVNEGCCEVREASFKFEEERCEDWYFNKQNFFEKLCVGNKSKVRIAYKFRFQSRDKKYHEELRVAYVVLGSCGAV